MTRCVQCHARLSRYAAPGAELCWPCDARKQISHADYLAGIEEAPARPIRLHGPDTCHRGHDLLVHGVIRIAEGTRKSRKCRECDRLRAKARRLNRTVEELMAS